MRARSGGRCECRGECGRSHPHGRCEARHGQPNPENGRRVVMTAAHLWRGPCAEHDALGIKCGDLSHLGGFCNGCHLLYDLSHHIAKRRRNRRARRAVADLFDPLPA